MTAREALIQAAGRLAGAGVESPRLEARLLLAHALGLTPESVIGDRTQLIDPARFDPLVTRRATGEPLAYILGYREFWSLRFAVSPATLVPRPESETLIEAARSALPQARRILDLGTGTGCLLIAALTEFPTAFGVGVDRSEAAVHLARDNAARLGVAGRASFACGDWDEALTGHFDLVLSNPPYVESAAIPRLMPEVARFEPRTALDGGPDGLDAYRRLLPALSDRLSPGGIAVLEIGAGQKDAVERLARAEGMTMCARADLAGIPRAVVLRNVPSRDQPFGKKPFGRADKGV